VLYPSLRRNRYLTEYDWLHQRLAEPAKVKPTKTKGLDTMKVLLLKDVYKLGRAGDVKRVADGYGRNFLIPQGLAVLATAGALKQVEQIRIHADAVRDQQNREMSGIADKLNDLVLTFPAKAGDTGKLYGSITSQMVSDAIQEKLGLEINRRMLDMEPIRNIGSHTIHARLTMDLMPELTVIVYREGETPEAALEEEAALAVIFESETVTIFDEESIVDEIEETESEAVTEEAEE